MLMFHIIFAFYMVGKVQAGCYQKRLCCPGRNLSCTAIDDGIEHLPLRPFVRQMTPTKTTTTSTTSTPTTTSSGDQVHSPRLYDEQMQRIEHIVHPDIIDLEGSGNELYDKYGERIQLDAVSIEPMEVVELGTTIAPAFKRIVFGEAFFPLEQPFEITRTRRDGLPRNANDDQYSLLNQHLPISVGDITDYDDESNVSKYIYLESSHENRCYCDEICTTFGDCCSDYTFVCPPSDCYLTNWSDWSPCIADDNEGKCGNGVKTRVREIRRGPRFGGAECPPLVEKISCFEECHRQTEDITTVALLLDYQYNKIREKLARDNIYWDLPEVASKIEKLSYYCVTYEIGWVNQNCVDKKVTSKLHKGNVICAECQPEAQLHRNNMRCASDLNDDEYGLWKFIGAKSCNGIWRRISRSDNCKCEHNYPTNVSFLLV